MRAAAVIVSIAGGLLGAATLHAAERIAAVPLKQRPESSVHVSADGGGSVAVEATSKSGIGGATVSRTGDEWPDKIVIRLRLKGLESFTVKAGETIVEWSVASTGNHESRVMQSRGRIVLPLKKGDRYHSPARIVAKKAKIPLEDGYFEIALPPELLAGNPAEITLKWIDFYR